MSFLLLKMKARILTADRFKNTCLKKLQLGARLKVVDDDQVLQYLAEFLNYHGCPEMPPAYRML